MFYRVDGDTRERPFGNYTKTDGGTVAMSGSPSGNTMTYSITESAASGTRFTATWTLQLQDGTVPGEATVLHSVTVTNPTASPLTLSLYHFLDFDLAESTSDSATGGMNEMKVADGGLYGTYKPLTTASRFQASAGTLHAGRRTTGRRRHEPEQLRPAVPTTTGPARTSGTCWSRPMDRPQSSSRWGSARCPSRGRSSRWPRPGWVSPGWPAALA